MDIDIDLADRNLLLNKIQHRVAKLKNGKNHNTGIYVTEIPHNPINNQATIDYKQAESRGYFKIDILNLSIYKEVKSEQHLQKLMNQEPLWELLEHSEFTDQLFHIKGHSEIMKKLKPRCVEQLACAMAIIRPAKRYLLNSSWEKIYKEVWLVPSDNSYFWKKSHAFAYAFATIVHINLLCEQMISNS